LLVYEGVLHLTGAPLDDSASMPFVRSGAPANGLPAYIYSTNTKENALKALTDSSYNLILDSDELSPFDKNSMTNNLIFQNVKSEIKLFQADW